MKTVSLELAKELRKNGYPQRNCDHYYDGKVLKRADHSYDVASTMSEMAGKPNVFASPTAEDIIDKLPHRIQIDRYTDNSYGLYWLEQTSSEYKKSHLEKSAGLVSVAAKMYIFLKEEGLI